jgi:hypothetical protein
MAHVQPRVARDGEAKAPLFDGVHADDGVGVSLCHGGFRPETAIRGDRSEVIHMDDVVDFGARGQGQTGFACQF